MKSRLTTTAIWCALLFGAASADLAAQTTQPSVEGNLSIQGTLIIQEPAAAPTEAQPQLVILGLEDFAPTYGPPSVASAPECGGMLSNGQPQAACPPKIATKVGAARRDCPSGSFFDLTTWSCWQCPANFNRSAAPVVSEQACGQSTAAGLTRVRATLLGGRCPQGSFFDPIRGGECWSCPSGYRRTVFSVEDRGWACETGANIFELKKSAATFIKKGVCEAGTIFDPRNGGECWTCPSGMLRTVFPVNEANACETPAGIAYKPATKTAPLTCKTSETFDPIGGGTCWVCPESYERSSSRVDSATACKAGLITWKTAPFREPGLLGLPGAGAVLFEATQSNPKLVQSTIQLVASKLAASSGQPLATVLAEQKRLYAYEPQHSVVAAAVVLTRLLAASTDPATASANEQTLMKSFSDYVIAKRTYIATDMLAAYDNWYASNEYWREKRHLTQGLSGLVSYGTVPPDFDKLGMAAAVGIGATAGAISMGTESAVELLKLAKSAERLNLIGDAIGLALNSAGAGWNSSTSGELVAASLARQVGEIAVGQAISELLKLLAQVPAMTIMGTQVSMVALSTTGPQIIVTGGMILAGIAIDQMVKITEARPRLVSSIQDAKNDPDLVRMAKSKSGIGQIETFWSIATVAGRSPPGSFMVAFTPAAQNALK